MSYQCCTGGTRRRSPASSLLPLLMRLQKVIVIMDIGLTDIIVIVAQEEG